MAEDGFRRLITNEIERLAVSTRGIVTKMGRVTDVRGHPFTVIGPREASTLEVNPAKRLVRGTPALRAWRVRGASSPIPGLPTF
jgi:hypothetical protein